MRLLLTTVINVNHINNLGWTALPEVAISRDRGARNTEIVKFPIKHGANVNAADKRRIPPLAHAEQRGQRIIIKMLRNSVEALAATIF